MQTNIHKFFSLIQKAEVTFETYTTSHKSMDGEELLGITNEIETDAWFNKHFSEKSFRITLYATIELMRDEIQEKISECDTKYERMMFLSNFHQKIKNLHLLFSFKEFSNEDYLSHCNYIVKNISKQEEFKQDIISERQFNGYYIIMKEAINSVNDYLTSISPLIENSNHSELNKQNKGKSLNSPASPLKKIKWHSKINLLTTLFEDLVQDKHIEASDSELVGFIMANFVDSEGRELSKSTIQTYIGRSHFHKKAKSHKKINIQKLKDI